MDQPRSILEQQLEELTSRLESVEHRLAALEGARFAAEAPAEPVAPDASSEASGSLIAGGTPALIGRCLLVLAGAFALRSLTESQLWPAALGIALGVLYGLSWLWLADRTAARGAAVSATVHGVSAAIVVFPLLVEATIKFRFLAPLVGAAALLIVGALGLFVARRRSLPALIWVMSLGTALTSLTLAVLTLELVAGAGVLMLLALCAFWAGARDGHAGPAWLVVTLLDGLVLMMTLIALVAHPEQAARLFSSAAVMTVLLALVTVSFAAFIARTWRTGRAVRGSEIAQGIAASVIGFGGALALTHRSGTAALATGVVGLLLAAATYAASFTFIDRIAARRVSFIFYTTAALCFTLMGAASLWHGSALAIALSAAGLATAWIGSRKQRETLSLHASMYIVAAATVTGLAGLSLAALIGGDGPAQTLPPPALLIVLAVAAVFCWLPVAGHGRTWGTLSRVVKVVVLVVLLLGIDDIVVGLGASLLPRDAESHVSGAALAVLRTGLIAISAVVLPLLGGATRLHEAAWLVYPLLIAGGLKLLYEDLRSGQPAALMLSLALYGGALILAPRLARRTAIRVRGTTPPTPGAAA